MGEPDIAEDLGEQEAPEPVTPVPVTGTVHLGHAADVQAQAADFGAYMTYLTPAGADVARPILPYDANRHRAVLIVSGIAGAVYIGTQAQCQANPPVGGWLPIGTSLPVEHKQPVWMIGDGTNSVRVTVAVERWA